MDEVQLCLEHVFLSILGVREAIAHRCKNTDTPRHIGQKTAENDEVRELWAMAVEAMTAQQKRIEKETEIDAQTKAKLHSTLLCVQRCTDRVFGVSRPFLANEYNNTIRARPKDHSFCMSPPIVQPPPPLDDGPPPLVTTPSKLLEPASDDTINFVYLTSKTTSIGQIVQVLKDALNIHRRVDDARAVTTKHSLSGDVTDALRALIEALETQANEEVEREDQSALNDQLDQFSEALSALEESLSEKDLTTKEGLLAPDTLTAAERVVATGTALSQINSSNGSLSVADTRQLVRSTSSCGTIPLLSSIRSASVDDLIDLITGGAVEYQSQICGVLLLTYRYFMSVPTFIEKLVLRYCTSPEFPLLDAEEAAEFEEEDTLNVRERVMTIIERWVKHYYIEDFYEESNRLSLARFLKNTVLSTGLAERAEEVLSVIKEKSKIERVTIPPKPTTLANTPSFSVMTYSPLDFARKLTSLEHRMYCALHSGEFLNQKWSKPDKSMTAPQLTRNSEHFNRVGMWVVTSVVQTEDVSRRAQIIRKFLLIALHLYKLNNYQGTMEILAGLQATPVARLRSTWRLVGWDHFVIKQTLHILFHSNYLFLRKELNEAKQPTVPYLGMYQQDLTFLEDGNPTFNEDGTINFWKCQRIHGVISEVMRFKDLAFSAEIASDDTFDAGISGAVVMDYDEAFKVSLRLEPTAEVSDIQKFQYDPIEESGEDKALSLLRALRSHPLLLRRDISSSDLSTHADPTSGSNQLSSKDDLTDYLAEVVLCMKNPLTGVKIKNRKRMLKSYDNCFVGAETVSWMKESLGKPRVEAERLCKQLVEHGMIRCVGGGDAKEFKNSKLALYVFAEMGMSE